MTSLPFGVFLLLFSAFIAVVPAEAWMYPVENSIATGDQFGRGFDASMERLEGNISYIAFLGAHVPLPSEVRGSQHPVTAFRARRNAAYVSFLIGKNMPRSLPSTLPAAVRGGKGTPRDRIASTLSMIDRNLQMNPRTLIQSINGRPRYLQGRQFRGLRRFRRQIPLKVNAAAPESSSASAS